MIISAKGCVDKVIAFRASPGEDVLGALEKVCVEHSISNGIILSAIGSLDGAKFFTPVPLNNKAGAGYSDPIELVGPIELLNATGMITHKENGDPDFHVHCTFSNGKGTSYGGHLIQGNTVLLTLDVVIGEIKGIDMVREFDEELEVPIFRPKQMVVEN